MARSQSMARTIVSTDLNFVEGSYAGNGLDGRVIEIGFQPDFVIIKGDTSQYAVFRTSSFVGDKTGNLGSNAANFANAIQTFETNGFSLGSDATVNSAGVMYYWIACKAPANTTQLKVGTYTGDGTSSKAITGVGFQPDFVYVKPDSAEYGLWKTSSDTTLSHYITSAQADDAEQIKTLDSDGFTVGSGRLNGSTVVHYYIALKNVTGVFKVGTYSGNGADDRSITGLGFQPTSVVVKQTSQICRFRNAHFNGDLAIGLMNGTSANNQIQAFGADGFTVGTHASVNGNGVAAFWFAFKSNRSRLVA